MSDPESRRARGEAGLVEAQWLGSYRIRWRSDDEEFWWRWLGRRLMSRWWLAVVISSELV